MTAVNEDFINAFSLVQGRAFFINYKNGWWEDREKIILAYPDSLPIVMTGTCGLMATEISEAIEAIRKHSPETWADAGTKDTLVRELAGCIVRIMDTAEFLKLPLGEAVIAEIEANGTRGYKHGGKAC